VGAEIAELGWGRHSLPILREFGFDVCGVDYSEGGCDLAREMCRRNAVNAKITCADFFHPPRELNGAFDVVVSFGVVEHFTDTGSTIGKFSEFLRPGGLLLTVVPNIGGLVGLSQRLLNQQVYDTHESISPARLAAAHRESGLRSLRMPTSCSRTLASSIPAHAGSIKLTAHRAPKALSAEYGPSSRLSGHCRAII
jgi:2-polyprenyl-3-methyl-5-hydroxy-6-metoxy-1,4-benzoquinol methylase